MNNTKKAWYQNPWYGLGGGLFLILLSGLFLHIMDVDAAQYASISMEMLQNGSWLQVFHRQFDYLDKPPLLFWTSAASFAIFGLSDWAYKLPSFLAALGAIYAIWRFSLLYYSRETAIQAAFILASALGLVIICNDVRTDTLLLGMSTCSIWQFAEYLENKKTRHFIGAFVFAALAMLAKGPIGLVVPGFAVGTQLMLQRKWRDIFQLRWLLGLGIVAIILAPMCWGLYHQFDLHPEKTVNDRTGVSGLYFFFWEQSFGRITGENVWHNHAPWYYFIHVYLWAFLPWPLLLIWALWDRLKQLIQQRFRLLPSDEAYSIGAFVLTFLALSQSKYKLPHYIFITLPWAAVLTARLLEQASGKSIRAMAYMQAFVSMVLLAGVTALISFVFPTKNLLIWLVWVLFMSWWVLNNLKKRPDTALQLVQNQVATMLMVLGTLNLYFYPNLLPYQSTSALMLQARADHLPAEKMAFFRRHGHALDFYNGALLHKMDSVGQIRAFAHQQGEMYLYTNETGKTELDSAGYPYTVYCRFGHFQVAQLKPAFLNPSSRSSTLEPVYLLKISDF